MTREQAKQMLINLGIQEPTEEQISNYLNSVNGEVQKEKEKNKTDKEELERLKQVEAELEAEKNKNLTAEQKLQAELEKAAKLQKEYARKANQLEVEKILVGAGLTKEDYADYIDLLVSDDSEKSTKLANGLVATLTKQKEVTEKKVKADLLNNTPTPDGGSGGSDNKTEAEKFVEELVASKVSVDKASQEALNYYVVGGNK